MPGLKLNEVSDDGKFFRGAMECMIVALTS